MKGEGPLVDARCLVVINGCGGGGVDLTGELWITMG